MSDARVAFVQDHLVQRGGAERGLLSMLKAAPGADIVTSFYEPSQCYPEFKNVRVRTLGLNRLGPLRRRHRLALPLLPLAFSRTNVKADVVVCGTSGWAQGVRTPGRKVVYLYALTRWLYERDAYLRSGWSARRVALGAIRSPLERWDRRTMATGDRFVTEGTVMQRRIREIYGIEAEILPLPNTLDPDAPREPVERLDPGFFLCPSRLMPYKNVDLVIEAFRRMANEQLVVAGDGPLLDALRRSAPPNVRLLGVCDDATLRWLYGNCVGVVSAAVEPFGLTPVEGAAFGRPTVALADGGFVDTVIDGTTGVHFARAEPALIVEAIERLRQLDLDENRIRDHAHRYDEPIFVDGIRRIIDEELSKR